MFLQISVQGHDGKPVAFERRRQVRISTQVRTETGSRRTISDVSKTIPDDSIVRHVIVPESDDVMITVRVRHALRNNVVFS